jgi:hypothetical protein
MVNFADSVNAANNVSRSDREQFNFNSVIQTDISSKAQNIA